MFQKSKSLKINNIDFIVLIIDEYILINFFIFNKVNNETIIVCFIYYVHIVDDFKIKKYNILYKQEKTYYNSYKNFVVLL